MKLKLPASDKNIAKLEAAMRAIEMKKHFDIEDLLSPIFASMETLSVSEVWNILLAVINFTARFHKSEHRVLPYRNPIKIIGESKSNPDDKSFLGSVEIDSKTKYFKAGVLGPVEELSELLWELEIRLRKIQPKVFWDKEKRAEYVRIPVNPKKILADEYRTIMMRSLRMENKKLEKKNNDLAAKLRRQRKKQPGTLKSKPISSNVNRRRKVL